MNYTINNDHIELTVHPVNQNGATFYIGKLSAQLLLEIYTVRPTKYDLHKHTEFAKTFDDDKAYYDSLIEVDKNSIEKKDFQRTYDPNRINKIANFLNEEKYPFFPNTIISNDYFHISTLQDFYNCKEKPNHLAFLDEENNILSIPKTSDSLLVIDGQHRLKGLENANDNVKDNYEVVLAFILGVGRSIVAKQFYTINYEQKSVNKSLLYHLTGEFSTEIDEISFLHNVVRALNELEKSPFHRRVKMLGSNPKDATQEEKQLLSISQAFLIDALMKTISKNALGSLYIPIFLAHFKKKEYQVEVVRFLIKYFDVVKFINKGWDEPTNSLVSKGMGVGALLKVLQLIFPIIFLKEINTYELSLIKNDIITKYLKGFENVDLTKEGPYGGVGSGGSINKIKSYIIENLEYLKDLLNYKTYDEFIKESENYRSEFNKWLKKSIS